MPRYNISFPVPPVGVMSVSVENGSTDVHLKIDGQAFLLPMSYAKTLQLALDAALDCACNNALATSPQGVWASWMDECAAHDFNDES